MSIRNTLPRDQRSRILEYTHNDFQSLEDYEYKPLKDVKRSIRLLRLIGNSIETPIIDCELFEVTFNKQYKPMKNENGVQIEVAYRALSWCWGTDEPKHVIRLAHPDGSHSKMKIKKDLAMALKYLRKVNKTLIFWIDAICIDQSNNGERNHQVQMMSMIYTRASKVCVWLGEDDNNSEMAISFIREKISTLERFDELCEDNKNAENWQALLSLMQREWFRRRWVVQEIALSRKAKIYCGRDKISWKDFTVAVELFVEVESATHRLSEVIQKHERFYHVPGWFEYVSELGASLLVSATAKVFRGIESKYGTSKESRSKELSSMPNGTDEDLQHAEDQNGGSRSSVEVDEDKQQESEPEEVTIDPLGRRGLLSLEYLVLALSTFEASEPRDTIYSLLAIARDTSPFAETNSYWGENADETLVMATLSSFLQKKPYRVDYSLPYSDVCKDFISFCITRSQALNPSQALDIICRPWALPPRLTEANSTPTKGDKKKNRKNSTQGKKSTESKTDGSVESPRMRLYSPGQSQNDDYIIRPKRSNTLSQMNGPQIFKRTQEEKGKSERLLQIAQRYSEGLEIPDEDGALIEEIKDFNSWSRDKCSWPWFVRAQKTRSLMNGHIDEDEPNGFEPFNVQRPVKREDPGYEVDPRDHDEYWGNMYPPDMPKLDSSELKSARKIWKHFPGPWKGRGPAPGEENHEVQKSNKDIDLPTWVASIDGAPFGLHKFPGMHVQRTGRKNADSLVGLPEDGHRNYSAAQTQKATELRFCKRPVLGHYSLYVKGFILDKVEEVAAPANGGNIPKSWTKAAGWNDLSEDKLPDAFVRTLVADRGTNNRNPPYYYAKACVESMTKGSIESGRVNIESLINNERNSIITEFCRRVQAVVWNRCLIKTANGRLGLVSEKVQKGDLVCIIYGCSVPVILRRCYKVEGEDPDLVKESDENEKDKNADLEFDQGLEKLAEDLNVNRDALIKGVSELRARLLPREAKAKAEASTEVERAKLNERLEEETYEDRVQMLKEFIRRSEIGFVRRARYENLKKEGFHGLNGEEYGEHIRKETKAVNDFLRKQRVIRKDIEKMELDARERSQEINKNRKFDGSSEDRSPHRDEKLKEWERDFTDRHYFYQVMGESYIHGMMDGDAIRERFERQIKEREFELR